MSAAGATSAATTAAVTAAIAAAIKASGTIVRVSPEDFLSILARMEAPLVVQATGGVFSKHQKYLTSYKGLAFVAQSRQPLELPAGAEVVRAAKIWMPD